MSSCAASMKSSLSLEDAAAEVNATFAQEGVLERVVWRQVGKGGRERLEIAL